MVFNNVRDPIQTEFQVLLEKKGWSDKSLAIQWGLSERQARRIIRKPKVRDLNALQGLPYLITDNTVERAKQYLQNHAINHVEFLYLESSPGTLDILKHNLPTDFNEPEEFLQTLLILQGHLAETASIPTLFKQTFVIEDTINSIELSIEDSVEGASFIQCSFSWDVTSLVQEGLRYDPLEVMAAAFESEDIEDIKAPDASHFAIALDVVCKYEINNGESNPFAKSR